MPTERSVSIAFAAIASPAARSSLRSSAANRRPASALSGAVSRMDCQSAFATTAEPAPSYSRARAARKAVEPGAMLLLRATSFSANGSVAAGRAGSRSRSFTMRCPGRVAHVQQAAFLIEGDHGQIGQRLLFRAGNRGEAPDEAPVTAEALDDAFRGRHDTAVGGDDERRGCERPRRVDQRDQEVGPGFRHRKRS